MQINLSIGEPISPVYWSLPMPTLRAGRPQKRQSGSSLLRSARTDCGPHQASVLFPCRSGRVWRWPLAFKCKAVELYFHVRISPHDGLPASPRMTHFCLGWYSSSPPLRSSLDTKSYTTPVTIATLYRVLSTFYSKRTRIWTKFRIAVHSKLVAEINLGQVRRHRCAWQRLI
jgi:hypothetical protein